MGQTVPQLHKELMHYTTANGLEGILSSGALWATHASTLNDAKEIIHFLEMGLPDVVEAGVGDFLRHVEKSGAGLLPPHENNFDAQVAEQVTQITALLRDSTLRFHEPFIFSMSAVPDSERIRKSGLLSQWRAYGGDGGYALVFDALEFEKLLQEEGARNFYQHVQWGDVFYYGVSDKEDALYDHIRDAEDALRKGIFRLHTDAGTEAMVDSYDAMITLSCLYKHWAFHEEKEVRVVAIPPNSEVVEVGRRSGVDVPPKEIRSFARDGVLVPYVELFKRPDSERKLPITRVIVGPHPLSAVRKKTVEMILRAHGYSVDVVVSEMPYIGR